MSGEYMNLKELARHLFPILTILLLFVTMQCYTTFKHPKIYSDSDSTGVYLSDEVTFIDDCSACHEQNNFLIDSHLQVYDYPIYEENYSWQYYYAIPWWVDEYYYEARTQNEQNASLPAPPRRDFDRRKIPPSPATSLSGVSGGSLSKPSSEKSTAPTSSQPTPTKRNERRQVSTKDSNSKDSTGAGPARVKREEKKTKKEKK